MMRMLTVEETKAAMGFPASYILPPHHKDAMMLLGNAVPPPMAKGVIKQIKEKFE